MNSTPRLWRWFFGLAALEAGAAFVALLAIPHEAGSFSIARLAMLLVLGALCLAAVVAGVRFARAAQSLARPRLAWAAFILVLFLAVALFLLRYLQPERLLPYYVRLSPLLWYLLLTGAEFCIFCLVSLFGVHPEHVAEEKATWRPGVVALAVLLLVFVFVSITQIGLKPDNAYWGEPGPPVLAWQLGVVLLGGTILCLVARRRGAMPPKIDLILGATIWALAVLIWLSVPPGVMKNSFYAPINPPAYQPFPNSDAGYYDSMAQSLLIGYPYQGQIPTRPLYITLLTLLHVLAGQRYDLVIGGQTLCLAAIPVLLYYLGKQLHSRAAGVMAALLAIFREWNSLLISSQTRVSNSKTLLVDLPTLLILLLACLFVTRWLERKDKWDALLSGGMLGLVLLLRTQSLLLLPIVLVLAIVGLGARSRGLGARSRGLGAALGLFAAGFLVAIAPWLVHNYLQSGRITLDAAFQYQVIASQYKYTGNLDLGSVDLTGKSVPAILLTFALKDPGFVAGFISAHFLATLVDSVLALPLAARFDGLLAPLYLYWIQWTAQLDMVNIALILLYLAVIAVGLGAAWRRLRWAGMVPLVFALGYALANGIGRFSGWRYDLPADWVAYFYFAMGAAELFLTLASLFSHRREEESDAGKDVSAQPLSRRRVGLVLTAIALAGLLPWLAEGLAVPRYADQSLSVLMKRLAASMGVQALSVNEADIQRFAASPQATLQIGRMLYPRFFTRGDGIASSHPWPAWASRDYPRIGFYLLNQSGHDAVMALRQSQAGFAQGSDAIILGCQRQDYIEVRLILFPDTDLAYQAAPLSEGCN